MTRYQMMRITSFILSCIFFSASFAQTVYDIETIPTHGTVSGIVTLPDGNILTAGTRNDELHLIKWDPNGDTIWTRHHSGIPGAHPSSLFTLSTGEIRLTTTGQEHFLEQSGEILWSNTLSGAYQQELGEDSLLYITTSAGIERFELRDRTGNIFWTSDPLVHYDPNNVSGSSSMAVATGSGLIAYTISYPNIQTMFDYALIRSLYSTEGVFQDSTLVYFASSGQLGPVSMINTADGGSLAILYRGSTGFMLFRADPLGSGVWMEHLGQNMDAAMQARGVTELSDGRFILSGHRLDLSNETNHPCLIEISAEGELLCTEDLWPAEPMQSYPWSLGERLTRTDGDRVHVLMQTGSFSPTIQKLHGFGPVYCLSTSLPDDQIQQPELQIQPGQLSIIGTQAGKRWSIHNSLGSLIASGRTQEGSTRISIDDRGLFVLTIYGSPLTSSKFVMQ